MFQPVMHLTILLMLVMTQAAGLVDFHNVKNAEEHHTNLYRLRNEGVLPLRRCDSFLVSLGKSAFNVLTSSALSPKDLEISFLLQPTTKEAPITIPYNKDPTPGWGYWNGTKICIRITL